MSESTSQTAEPVVDTSTQPVVLRRRNDIEVSESEFQGEKCWILKDPITLKYYRIREPEFLIFNMLSGDTTLEKIQAALSKLLGGVEVDEQQVRNLIGSLYQRELLIGKKRGQAQQLLDRQAKLTKMKRVARFTNLLSIRFPGVDPEKFLTWLYPKTKWFFHPLAVMFFVLLMMVAGLSVIVNANEFAARLPAMEQFFGFRNLFMMGLLLVLTKSLHEIGHGLVCKHFGGECHEIGFMLLVLMPVMYCNTSDSWVLKNKWHRIAIGAAGIYVEVIVASICTLIWWYTNPGLLNFICLNVMFLSSLTTVIFNANPLLRYDGYYILSDFLEIPNMGQKSRASLLSKLRTLCLGFPPLPSRMLPQRNQLAFAFYSVASFCYRWFILFVILWFISKLFEPYGLQIIGQYMIGVSLISMFVFPAVKLYKFFSHEKVRSQVNKFRLAVTIVVLAALATIVGLVPIPQYVNAPFLIRPSEMEFVYVTNPGTLAECWVKPGQRVEKNEEIARLVNLEAEARMTQINGEIKSLQTEIDLLTQIESTDPTQVQQLSSRFEQLRALVSRQLVEKRIVDSLVLKADLAGVILAPEMMRPESPDPQQLERWTGSPMDRENINAYLERNTEFCRIDTSGKFEAVLEIDQTNIDLVRENCDVNLVLDEYQMQRLQGSIKEVAISETSVISSEFSQNTGGSIATRPDQFGRQTAIFTSYQAIVPINASQTDLELMTGFRGNARIHCGNKPLGQQIWRYIRTVFNFS